MNWHANWIWIPTAANPNNLYIHARREFALPSATKARVYVSAGQLYRLFVNGQPVPGLTRRKTIVNDPLTYKGITFYQSSYGQASEGGEHTFSVKPRSGGAAEKFAIREGAATTLKDGTSFRMLEATQEVRQFMPGFTGPAARGT